MKSPLISISVVSHLQYDLVSQLLLDIQQHCVSPIEVILTINASEKGSFDPGAFRFPVIIIRNGSPKGFGANHNAALKMSNGNLFCIMNPDIRLTCDPFPILLETMDKFGAGIVAPFVINSTGHMEDTARRFPTPLSILLKAFGVRKKIVHLQNDEAIFSDWVGGMFMLIPAGIYRKLGGFDEAYFLYYEDVDLCARALLKGYKVMLIPGISVIHDARRSSHRNLKYMAWHLASMMRFFLSMPFLKICWQRWTKQTT